MLVLKVPWSVLQHVIYRQGLWRRQKGPWVSEDWEKYTSEGTDPSGKNHLTNWKTWLHSEGMTPWYSFISKKLSWGLASAGLLLFGRMSVSHQWAAAEPEADEMLRNASAVRQFASAGVSTEFPSPVDFIPLPSNQGGLITGITWDGQFKKWVCGWL